MVKPVKTDLHLLTDRESPDGIIALTAPQPIPTPLHNRPRSRAPDVDTLNAIRCPSGVSDSHSAFYIVHSGICPPSRVSPSIHPHVQFTDFTSSATSNEMGHCSLWASYNRLPIPPRLHGGTVQPSHCGLTSIF